MSDQASSETGGHPPNTKGVFSLALAALILSLVAPLVVVVAIMGLTTNNLDYETGFRQMTLGWAPKAATITLVISLFSLLISIFVSPLRTGPLALAAVVISGGTLGGYYAYERALKTYPPIHDVATSWQRPVTFSEKLMKNRGPGANPVEDDPRVPKAVSYEWAGKTIAEVNAQTCPGAKPIPGKTVDADKVAARLTAAGYVVFGRSPWRVEAVYVSPVFAFKSDLVVRLDPDQIDVRSVSRDEVSDLGGNCRRVVEVLDILKTL